MLQGKAGDDRDEVEEGITAMSIEQYLNDAVALQVFKKFGVLLRVHLK